MEIFPVRLQRDGAIQVNDVNIAKNNFFFQTQDCQKQVSFLVSVIFLSCTSDRSWLCLLASSGGSTRQAGLCSEPSIHVCLTHRDKWSPGAVPGTGQLGTHKEGTQKGSHEDICSCGFQAALQGHWQSTGQKELISEVNGEKVNGTGASTSTYTNKYYSEGARALKYTLGFVWFSFCCQWKSPWNHSTWQSLHCFTKAWLEE